MFATFLISFREFLEAFLIIGVFLGISKKLGLKREREIVGASLLGIIISLILPTLTFLAGDRARIVLSERNADLLEGYLMIFSGIFLVYVIFSLHKFFILKRSQAVLKAHEKLTKNLFDVSLFLTLVFFIIREGFEIALFAGTTSLFSEFAQNMTGLLVGFAASCLLGILTFYAYVKFPIGRIFKFTEYLIILLGASFVTNGTNELVEVYFHTHLSKILPLHLWFLPTSSSMIGHMIKTMFGLEQHFSFVKLGIMGSYIFLVYFLLIKKPKKVM